MEKLCRHHQVICPDNDDSFVMESLASIKLSIYSNRDLGVILFMYKVTLKELLQ